MSTVWDVETITLDEGNPALAGNIVDTIDISIADDGVESVTVEVPGPQGAPGLQNVYTGLTNPATVPGEEWGAEEKGFVWIEVDV